jgi:hypothetical protein
MSNLIVPIVLLISSIGLIFTYTLPAYETLQAFQEQDGRLNQAQAMVENVAVAKTKLSERYISIPQVNLDRLNLIVPSKIDVVQTIIVLDRLANENNLSIESFGLPGSEDGERTYRSQVEEEQPDYETAKFTIVMYGTYENMKRMLYHIERSVALMDVAELYIEPVESKKDEPPTDILKHTIVMSTYSLTK